MQKNCPWSPSLARWNLPYWKEPFPDELLGSWLHRLMRLNCISSFPRFLNALGLFVNSKSYVADPWKGAGYVQAIGELFECDYKSFLCALTTRGYADCFLQETLDGQKGLNNGSRKARGSLRICPACIERDSELGAPYFHRAHQLWIGVCHIHGLTLQDVCVSCSRPVRSANDPTFFPMHCACGASYAATLPRQCEHENWRLLAQFCREALDGARHALDIAHARTLAIDLAVRAAKRSASQSVETCLVEEFGRNGLERLLEASSFYGEGVKRETNLEGICVARMPRHVVAAILVANKVSFKHAREEVSIRQRRTTTPLTNIVTVDGHRGHVFLPTSVEHAKAIAREFVDRTQFKWKRPHAYWMLYLQAPSWLRDLYDEGGRRGRSFVVPPTIVQDRLLITKTTRRHRAPQAIARAFMRDRSWLSDFQAQKLLNPSRHAATTKHLRERQRNRATAIEQQLVAERELHMLALTRPVKWTIAEASRRLKISNRALSGFTSTFPSLQALVPESSTQFRERVFEWALAKSLNDGHEPTVSQLLALSQITSSSPSIRKQAASVLGRHHARQQEPPQH